MGTSKAALPKVLMPEIAALVLLMLFALLGIASYVVKSPTFDEVQHLPCGYAMLHKKTLDLGVGHPPLFRVISALPLLFLEPAMPEDHPLFAQEYSDDPRTYRFEEDYSFGFVFLYRSGNDPRAIFFWGRLMSVITGVLLGAGVFALARRLYGASGALFSLFLYSFSPTMLAHARIAVNDLAGAAGIFLTLYMFCRYMEKNDIPNCVILGVTAGAALLIKSNSIILLPFVLAGMLLADGRKTLLRYPVFILAAVITINIFYGFDGTFRIKTVDHGLFSMLVPMNIFDGILYHAYRFMPLPEFYLKCLVHTIYKSSLGGHSAFLAGSYSVHGWWYYFPLAFLMKTPLVTLLLFLLMIADMIKPGKIDRREVLLIGFFALFWFSAVTSRINIGHRHILPVYPVMFVLSGRLYGRYFSAGKLPAFIILLLAYVFTTQMYFPHYIPYFNCLVRPENGYRYFADSNIDWGQDLPLLKKYLEENGNPALILSYFGTASREFYGIKHQELLNSTMNNERSDYINPVDTEKEYFAVSVTNLKGVYYRQKDIFAWLEKREPLKKIGYSIYIYDISRDLEAAAVFGEIYRVTGMDRHAERQYRRILHMKSEGPAADWARMRLGLVGSAR
ncbi:MAG: glycosyltransferase family 39 protein [Elusimicrobia bacterium]|nr:glycosyltransferase family 39 protein [Elusimicrobiota bacterium]